MRFAGAIVAFSLAMEALCAQPSPIAAQEVARARQLLQSSQWSDKAWGAYFAGRLHSEQLTEPLLEELRSAAAISSAPFQSEEYAFVAALFDALIQADITVPAADLQPFEQTWTDAVLILLARRQDGDSEDSLLRFSAENSRNGVWLAANNLLFERKSQRWFAKLLGETSITHRFTVTDADDAPDEEGGTEGGECGDGSASMPAGFPPTALYTLESSPKRGSVRLANGPENAYYARTIVPTGKQVGLGSCNVLVDHATVRIGYLADLADVPADRAKSLFRAETHVPYRSAEDFQHTVEQSLQAQEQGIFKLIEAVKKYRLTPDAGMRLQIVPTVIDQRKNATDPLPVVAPREIELD